MATTLPIGHRPALCKGEPDALARALTERDPRVARALGGFGVAEETVRVELKRLRAEVPVRSLGESLNAA